MRRYSVRNPCIDGTFIDGTFIDCEMIVYQKDNKRFNVLKLKQFICSGDESKNTPLQLLSIIRLKAKHSVFKVFHVRFKNYIDRGCSNKN